MEHTNEQCQRLASQMSNSDAQAWLLRNGWELVDEGDLMRDGEYLHYNQNTEAWQLS